MPRADLDVAPRRVGSARRGPNAGLVIGACLVALVVVAVAKPWGPESRPPTARPIAPPTLAPRNALAPEPPPPERAATAVDPIATRGDWDAVSSIVHEIAFHGGTWGAAAASWDGVTSRWVDWVALRARPGAPPEVAGGATGVASGSAGSQLRDAACRNGRLPSSPRIVAITGPAGLLGDVGVDVWQLRRTPVPLRTDLRIDSTADAPGVAFLVIGDGRPWADGAYRLIVESSDRSPVGLDVCIGPLPGFGGAKTVAQRG